MTETSLSSGFSINSESDIVVKARTKYVINHVHDKLRSYVPGKVAKENGVLVVTARATGRSLKHNEIIKMRYESRSCQHRWS